jgi:hypothetical protein
MTALGIAFGALGIVLIVSGLLKLADPEPTAAMLRELSPDTRRFPVWLIGIGELSLGLAAVALGGRVIAFLVAACYATFAAVSIKLVHRGGTLRAGASALVRRLRHSRTSASTWARQLWPCWPP